MKIQMRFIKLINVLPLVFLLACAEEYPGTEKIVTYPEIVLTGGTEVILTEGDVWVDEFVGLVGETEVTVVKTGSADPNVPGIYQISYEAENAEGFVATANRIVVVIESSLSAFDFAGTWARSTNGVINVLTKTSDRRYVTSNAGGFNATPATDILQIEIINVDDTNLYIPLQFDEDSGIQVQSINNGSAKINSATQIQYSFAASAVYGTAVRTFNKQ